MPHKIARRFLHKVEPYDHVIWDWNGTILNDVHIAVDSIGELLDKHELPRPTVEEYKKLFGFPVKGYYERLGFDLKQISFEKLSDHFIEAYENRVKSAEVFEGVIETLEAIGEGKTQSILSAAAQWHLEYIVQHFGLHVHFTHIYGLDNHYAASKIERGHELIKAAKVPLEKIILIGDTDHDLEVGKSLGVDVLLVADGHQSAERLGTVHHNVLKTRFTDES